MFCFVIHYIYTFSFRLLAIAIAAIHGITALMICFGNLFFFFSRNAKKICYEEKLTYTKWRFKFIKMERRENELNSSADNIKFLEAKIFHRIKKIKPQAS